MFERRPPSTRSHSRYRSARRQTPAASAERTSTPSCSTRQKYWLTSTACASVHSGSASASASMRGTSPSSAGCRKSSSSSESSSGGR